MQLGVDKEKKYKAIYQQIFLRVYLGLRWPIFLLLFVRKIYILIIQYIISHINGLGTSGLIQISIDKIIFFQFVHIYSNTRPKITLSYWNKIYPKVWKIWFTVEFRFHIIFLSTWLNKIYNKDSQFYFLLILK